MDGADDGMDGVDDGVDDGVEDGVDDGVEMIAEGAFDSSDGVKEVGLITGLLRV